MGRSTTDTCCITLPLKTEKWQEDRLEKRFEIARQIYNTLLGYELKKYKRLASSAEYASIVERIRNSENNHEENKKYKKQLGELLKKAGFSEYSFTVDMKPFYKHFSQNIGSHVAVHCIAKQVWQAFDNLLFKKEKDVHFKRHGDIYSLRGYSDSYKSGGTEICFKGKNIEWRGLILPIKLDANNQYEQEMLQKWVKYCRIIKKQDKHKTHWYVQLSLEGKPIVKTNHDTGEIKHPINKGVIGIDIGPQTIAYVSDKEVGLMELASAVNSIEHEKQILQRKMDRSRRATNPDNYNKDGTIKKGVKLTKKSKRYIQYQKQLAYIQRRQAETRKRQHNELANYLLTLGNVFYIENMEWAGLARRAKETEISPKTGKYKRKKRFGKSIGNKAPRTFVSLLDLKLKSRGLDGINEVPTSVKASQYNHLLDEYHKKSLSERWNNMPDGNRIQRDLYSAFLLQHMDMKSGSFDKASLKRDYEHFVELHDKCIEELKHAPKTISSMGIRRKAS